MLLEVVIGTPRRPCSSGFVGRLVFFLHGLLACVRCQPYDITGVRLVGGPPDAPNSGRVEVLHERSGNWLNVCDVNYWGDNDGTVACRQLGFPGYSRARRASYYGEGTNNGSVGSFGCSGDEHSLGQCPHQPIRENRGCNGRDAGLICTVPGFLGCFTDDRNSRVFPDMRFTADNMTIALCRDRCRRQAARYVGLENRRDCYCGAEGTRIDIHGRLRDRDCKSPCLGDPDEICGGGGKLSIYDLTLGYCTDPGTPATGGRLPATGDAFHYGENVSFFCDDGFELVGSDSARCVLGDSPQEVRWDEPMPQCRSLMVSTTPVSALGDDKHSSGLGAGRTAAIVGACVAVVVLVVVILVILVIRKRRGKLDRNANTNSEDKHGNAYSEQDHASRYRTATGSTGASSEYQDLTLPSNDAERPYTSLRKPALHRASEEETPEYLELYTEGINPTEARQGGTPLKLAVTGGADAGKRHKVSQTGKVRLSTPEVNENEYAYVDASSFGSDSQKLGGGQSQDARPQLPEEYAEIDAMYYSLPSYSR